MDRPTGALRWILGIFLSSLATAATPDSASTTDLAFPPITRQCKPWAYNWWLGSAIDGKNLGRELDRYKDGGLGGIHIIPIYGAKGAEARSVPYLSEKWMANLDMAVKEAAKRDMGVDMTTGTGWCFGGPEVTPDEAGIGLAIVQTDFPSDGKLGKKQVRRKTEWKFAEAVSPDGKRTSVLGKLDGSGVVHWKPEGSVKGWKLVAIGAFPTGIQVKRAAPGGEGSMVNPFYGQAMSHYLERFSKAFDAYEGAKPRAMYHDSYEYAMAAWSPDIVSEFTHRRGYKLEDHWEALAGFGDSDLVARVWYDYRLTISDLMVENVFPTWIDWCRKRGMLTRYQAHGSPGNLLDLYALADIPETEMFGHPTSNPLVSNIAEHVANPDRDICCSKFASSAAHVAGRQLVASETGTWMAEHFHETFEEMKCLVDRLFASGINHVFYHGCVYSPDDAAWPGWLFYASSQMNPRNPLWRDAGTLNTYVARVQSILQSGQSANDVLTYWPVCDLWMNPKPGVQQMTVPDRSRAPKVASQLNDQGYAFDYVSDRQLAQLKADKREVVAPGGRYRVLLIPSSQTIPLLSLQSALNLAHDGATVCFATPTAADVPGTDRLEVERTKLKELLKVLGDGDLKLLRTIPYGAGRIVVGPIDKLLPGVGVVPEGIANHAGAIFVRRSHSDGRHYFVANQSLQLMEGWFALATPAASVVAMDPMTGKAGVAQSPRPPNGACSVYLRLEPGQSVILRTFTTKVVTGPKFEFSQTGQSSWSLAGPWDVEFIEGGPTLPKPWHLTTLASWTSSGDPSAESFSGTARYTTHFDLPVQKNRLMLDLGEVRHTARVRLNGQPLGTLIMHPYRIDLPTNRLKPTGNLLEIEVANLGANRLRDLDRRQIDWRKFFFVGITYGTFDASKWPIEDSGLIGPVTIREVQSTKE